MQKRLSKSEVAKRLREEQLAEMSRKYRAVFSTPEGKVVLNHLIQSICMFSMKGMGATMTQLAVYDIATRKDVANDILKMLRGPVDKAAAGVAADDEQLHGGNAHQFDDDDEG